MMLLAPFNPAPLIGESPGSDYLSRRRGNQNTLYLRLLVRVQGIVARGFGSNNSKIRRYEKEKEKKWEFGGMGTFYCEHGVWNGSGARDVSKSDLQRLFFRPSASAAACSTCLLK